MKIKFKIKETCIFLIYLLIFLAALIYMRYSGAGSGILQRLYNACLIAVIVLSLFYLIAKAVNRYIVIDFLMLLTILLILYEAAISIWKDMMLFLPFLVDVVTWPLLLMVFYDYFRQYSLPEWFGKVTVVGLSLVCISSVPNLLVHLRGSGYSIFTVYFCMAFLPLTFLCCTKKTILIFNIIVTLLMLISVKRAVLLIMIIGLTVYYLLNNINENASRKKIRNLLLFFAGLLIIVFVGLYIVNRLNLNIIDRLNSMMEDGGSGRTEIWQTVWRKFASSPFSEKLFGHGFHAVYYRVMPMGVNRFAHNSWLETLYDYGIVGLGMIILLVLYLIVKTVKMIREKSAMAPVMSYTIVGMLIMATVSYFFEQSAIILPFCMVWGICIGSHYRNHHAIESRGE